MEVQMTREQREHIAATIGIMDMASAILKHAEYNNAAEVLTAQCEVMQDVLDNDVVEP